MIAELVAVSPSLNLASSPFLTQANHIPNISDLTLHFQFDEGSVFLGGVGVTISIRPLK